MLIEIAQAGVIAEAPTIYEIILRLINQVLLFVGALTTLVIMISGIIYITCSDNDRQEELAKFYLKNSIYGLVVILSSFVIVNAIVKLF